MKIIFAPIVEKPSLTWDQVNKGETVSYRSNPGLLYLKIEEGKALNLQTYTVATLSTMSGPGNRYLHPKKVELHVEL